MSENDGTKPKSLMAMLDDVDKGAKVDNELGRMMSELFHATQAAASSNPPPAVSTKGDDEPKASRQVEGKIERGGESGPIAAEGSKAASTSTKGDVDADRRARSGPFEGKHQAPPRGPAPINLVTAAARIPAPRPAPPDKALTR